MSWAGGIALGVLVVVVLLAVFAGWVANRFGGE